MKYEYFVSCRWEKDVDLSDEDKKVIEVTRLILPNFQLPKKSGFASGVLLADNKIDSEEKLDELSKVILETWKYDRITILGLTLLDTQED